MMNYEFHVGDFVQTKDDKIGYITKIRLNIGGKFYYVKYLNSHKDYDIMFNDNGRFEYFFKRIGHYDFTKPDVEKIEHLQPSEENYMVYNGDGITNLPCNYKKVRNDEESYYSMIDKINQLVDDVNKLNEKI